MSSPEQIDIVYESGRRKSGAARRFESLRKFFYNPRTGATFGRPEGECGSAFLFYAVFYAAIAAIFAFLIGIFYVAVNKDEPSYTGDGSLLEANPGVGFRPMADYQSTLIRFVQGSPATYKPYTDQIDAFLYFYSTKGQETGSTQATRCEGRSRPLSKTESCHFNTVLYFGADFCTYSKQYGFENGEPCVILYLNKVYGWMPETYRQDELPQEAKDKNVHVNNSVGVSCEGMNPSDKEHIGEIDIRPKIGFASGYFPFYNQYGYRQPLVFAQFKNVTNGLVVMVECRVWAKNLKESELYNRVGSVHFELLID